MNQYDLPCCEACCDKLVEHIKKLHEELLTKINQGLCLDCIRRGMLSDKLQHTNEEDSVSNSKSGSGSSESSDSESDSDRDSDEEEDLGCRVKH
jgi:hypothetical protein